ncbi:D-alanyl-D-alanine carboxypeptidase family protein [Paenibacillus dakarensis]|uniref:D-alanyl-D-alanine carboxypeptidase family protein n=1 Tax=Paenibacillus dakarensis TaxID=1527293 RepID=UPI0006D53A4F|nr:D-alanyl-D-alanine carboxypeptidase family protein [Paenibacillus dakarensis]
MNRLKGFTKRSMFICFTTLIFLLHSGSPAQAEYEKNVLNGPEHHAQAAAVIDVTSGRLLYSKRGDERMRIASLTKIMTAIVAIERGNLKDSVKITKNSFAKEGSSLFLKLGEEMSLENLLYGLMLRSGNDAASAIAEHVGGSEEGFVHMMNEKAAVLGLSNSHFMNPHGLDHDDHYSSANDLAKLTAYALKNPVFKEIVKTPVKKAPNPNEKWDYKWDNKNKMLRFYEGADGVKTGYTKKAFRCLVSSATRNGQQIAAVTLNDGNDWSDHANMLDYGFAHFPLSQIIAKGQKLKGYSLVTGKGFSYALAKGEEERVYKKLRLEKPGNPDLSFGLRGFIEVSLDGKLIGRVPVFAEGSRLPEEHLTSPSEKTAMNHRVKTGSLWEAAGKVLALMFGSDK